MNHLPRPQVQYHSRHVEVPSGTDDINRYIRPDELLFRHVRAASVEHGPPPPTAIIQALPDFNNNYIQDETYNTTGNGIPENYGAQTPASDSALTITRLRNQVHSSERSFQEERRQLLRRIHELENELDLTNVQRLEENELHVQKVKEAEDKANRASEELTRAVVKNVILLEENGSLKTTQQNLSTRMTSLEDQLHRLDAHSQEDIQIVLKRLEKRELSLKNQGRRLAQLESYYTRELNLLSSGTRTRPIPELSTEESSMIQLHPPPNPYTLSVPPISITTTRPVSSPGNSGPGGPVRVAGKNSYSELYYKTITDKAISLIQREAGTCNALLRKFKPAPIPTPVKCSPETTLEILNVASSDTDIEPEPVPNTKLRKYQTIKPQFESEEEEMLKILFFKF